MSFLDDLTHEEKESIISLPYRVGWWMSQCEDAGGEESDEQEIRVLHSVVDGYAREVFGAELVQYIMTETVMNKSRWDEWAKMDFQTIPDDCRKAMSILAQHGEPKEVHAFGHHLIEIAEAIAMAFSEYQYSSIFDKIRMYYIYYRESFKARRNKERYKSMHEFLSISKNERAVLLTLAEALGQEYS